ncbi:MAG: type II toxin-antitoxin system HicB family antitoxin [Lyngbya sp.]|nr:type II toxin-antitoxin system HicB family antitoxin [Lyngbya sp.]
MAELPGANVQEKTLEEARESLKEAIELILHTNREMAEREITGKDVIRESMQVII